MLASKDHMKGCSLSLDHQVVPAAPNLQAMKIMKLIPISTSCPSFQLEVLEDLFSLFFSFFFIFNVLIG